LSTVYREKFWEGDSLLDSDMFFVVKYVDFKSESPSQNFSL